jgi:integrase
VWTTEDRAVAAGLSVDLDRWQREFDELMLRVGARFAREESRRRMASFVRGLLAGLPRVNYQMVRRRGRQAGVEVHPHRFRHHFSHTWLERGGAEGDLMELNGWSSPQMLKRYGASARGARARRSYDRIMSGLS